MIKPAIDMEIQRQQGLIQISKDMNNRNASAEDIAATIEVLTGVFLESKSKLVKSALDREETVLGVRMGKCRGLLGLEIQPNKRFGTELSDRVKSLTPLKGIIHSDEDLSKYSFSQTELKEVRKRLNVGEADAFVLVIGTEYQARRAMKFVKERVVEGLMGVPEETRKVNADHTSTFMRELHGRARLYPDTDSQLVIIPDDRISSLEKALPDFPEVLVGKLESSYGLSRDEAIELLENEQIDNFMSIAETGANSKLICRTLTQTLTELRRNGVPVDNLGDKQYKGIFSGITNGSFAKEAIPVLLEHWAKNPSLELASLVEAAGTGTISIKDLDGLINRVIDENSSYITDRGSDAFSPLMGKVMKEARGRVDGKIIAERLREAISTRIEK